MVLGAAGILVVLFAVRSALVPFALAVLLTYLLNPPVTFLVNRGFPRAGAILAVYALIAGTVAVVIIWLVPGMLVELDQLGQAVPQFTHALENFVRGLQADYSRVPLPDSLRAAIDGSIVGLENRFIGMLNGFINSLVRLFPMLLNIILAPILAFYMLADLERFKDGFSRLLPKQYRTQLLSLGHDIDEVVYGFITGQVTVAIVEGSLVGLSMYVLGLRFSILIAIFYSLAELIPYFGPVLGTIPALASASIVSSAAVVKLAIAILLIQQLEASVLAPYLVGARIGLHPLTVIFALLVGGHYYGVGGLLLSVPFAALVKVIVRFGLRMAERHKEGIPELKRPGLTKLRSWRIVSSKIAQPLARPELDEQRDNVKGEEGKE